MTDVKSILNNTICILAGTVTSENSLAKIDYVLTHNLHLYNSCKMCVVSINKENSVSSDEFNSVIKTIKTKINNCIILVDHIDRQYQIGFIDLGLFAYNYIKNNDLTYDFILKKSIDILVSPEFLELEMELSCDVFFMPQFSSLHTVLHSKTDREDVKKEIYSNNIVCKKFTDSWCQPNLFLISKNVDFLSGVSFSNLEEMYIKWIFKTGGDTSQWRIQNELICSETIILNSFKNQPFLKKYCLLKERHFDNYCDFVIQYNIGDSTLKNIELKNYGITHFHYKLQNLFSINLDVC